MYVSWKNLLYFTSLSMRQNLLLLKSRYGYKEYSSAIEGTLLLCKVSVFGLHSWLTAIEKQTAFDLCHLDVLRCIFTICMRYVTGCNYVEIGFILFRNFMLQELFSAVHQYWYVNITWQFLLCILYSIAIGLIGQRWGVEMPMVFPREFSFISPLHADFSWLDILWKLTISLQTNGLDYTLCITYTISYNNSSVYSPDLTNMDRAFEVTWIDLV